MSLPKPLMFTVGLIDQITKPIAKISQRLNGLAANYQAGTMQMATGIGGITASGFALQNALMPAIEMNRALGEVSTLEVRDSALKMLAQNSYKYALKYGESAVDFVRSSYDIQSAISGLNGADLSRFTMSSNVLAKATKADAATITNYMGTMYGIFSKDAERMGKGAWIERVTGMTATAVQDFKTDGKKMSDAFGKLGAAAGLAPLEEQMAIMGKLQATMQGSESATKYIAFLAGVGKAQSALNLQFTDAKGNMLPMVDILNKIKGKFGETISVAEGDQLAKAFGSQEAVALVKLLLNDIDGLSGSINKLGQVNGMEQAEKMAAKMTDQSQRLAQSWFVIRAAFGSAVLPAFNEFVGKMANMGAEVLAFTDKFPNITRWLGYLGIGFMLAVAAGGLFTLMMGAGKMAIVIWTVAAGICTGVIKGLTWALKIQNWIMLASRLGIIANYVAFKAYFILLKMGTAATWLFGVAGKAVTATILLFGTALKAARWAMAALNVVMLANPIGLIIAGIAAAVVAVGALIYYWDEIKATMSEWGWVKAIGDVFNNMLVGIKNSFISFYNFVAEKLNTLRFVDIKLKPIIETVDNSKLHNITKLPANLPNQQGLPNWMQQKAANEPANYVYAAAKTVNVQRNLPAPYKPDPLTQKQYVQLVKPSEYAPKPINQQLNVQRNLPENYAPKALTQQQHLQLVKPSEYTPKAIDQQLNVQRNLPENYAPKALTQQQHLQLVKPAEYTPKAINQQLNVQRNLPENYAPKALTQQQHLQLVKPAEYTPKAIEQQLNVQRNLPENYTPKTLTQQQHLQLVKPTEYMPKAIDQQLNVQRNLPENYAPKALTQQQHVQLVKPSEYMPKAIDQQLNVQRNLPKNYAPKALTQQQHLQLVKPADYVPQAITQQLNVQRNLPRPYNAEPLTQPVTITPVANNSLSNMITPKLNQQAAATAQAKRAAASPQNGGKTLSFGDVIIQNPPKNFSLAELADQQELLTA